MPAPLPKPPKCLLKREGVSPDFPRDIEKYRIVKMNELPPKEIGGYQPNPVYPIYRVQLNIGFLFFDKWVDIGPVYCDTAEEAYEWIQNKVFPPLPESKETIVWTGKYSQSPPQGS